MNDNTKDKIFDTIDFVKDFIVYLIVLFLFFFIVSGVIMIFHGGNASADENVGMSATVMESEQRKCIEEVCHYKIK